MPLQAYYLESGNALPHSISTDDISAIFHAGTGLLWVDANETTQEDGEFLKNVFSFHHLAIEDCLSQQIHPPKIDRFGDHIFIIVHGINHAVESDIVETAELALFLGRNYVVTNHNYPLYSIAFVQHAIEQDSLPMQRGGDYLAHTIIDALVDNVMPTIDRMEDLADEIEEEVIGLSRQGILDGLLRLKRSAMKLRRIMIPQLDVLNRLSRGEFPQIHPDTQIYYRDIYDHIQRIEDRNANTLERADNALSTYLSSVANRQNETMRVLSIVATIFMPLTLLVGIYGMNFQYMPELAWKWSYFVILGIILAAILIMIWRFWSQGWISWGKRYLKWVKPFSVDARKLRGHFSFSRKD